MAYKNLKYMKTFKSIFFMLSRIILGIVFIYSGYVKGIDLLGATYKFTDYFTAFGMHWLTSLSFSLSIIQSLAELMIGIALLLNLKIKLSSLGALLFMLFFTPLTLYIAIANPVHDCGCFGDALLITNWQTFWKNIVLLLLAIFVFKHRKKSKNSFLSITNQNIMVFVFTTATISLFVYTYKHLPIQDFRPYKVGVNIPESMIIPEGATADVYESTFVYSKNGKEQTFEINNLPDSTWAFVKAEHHLVKKGYTPPIHDFTITTAEGIDLTDKVLENENYSFILIAYNLKKATIKNSDKINDLAAYCQEKGYEFFGLTASGSNDIDDFFSKTKTYFPFYNTDEITLKTIIRSNPGLLLIKEGTILAKWHINDFPKISDLKENLMAQSLTEYKLQKNKYLLYSIVLLSAFFVMLYLFIVKRKK